MKVVFRFIWYDIWIGIYIDRKNGRVYFCPLPCLCFCFYDGSGERDDYANTILHG